jgi:hypothetical protein
MKEYNRTLCVLCDSSKLITLSEFEQPIYECIDVNKIN